MLKKYCAILLSLPSWECGLKSDQYSMFMAGENVTPFVGVWIEIDQKTDIETIILPSLPSWECGLKYAE